MKRRVFGPLTKEEVAENKKLAIDLRERMLQLRIIDHPEEDDWLWDNNTNEQ